MGWKRIVATCVTAGVVVGGLGLGIASAADGNPIGPRNVPALTGERLQKACANLDALKARSENLGTRIDDRIAKLQERLPNVQRDAVKARLEQRLTRLQGARSQVGTRLAQLTEACAAG